MKSACLIVLLVLFLVPAAGEGIKWIDNPEEGLKQALTTGKPVIIDFYAPW